MPPMDRCAPMCYPSGRSQREETIQMRFLPCYRHFPGPMRVALLPLLLAIAISAAAQQPSAPPRKVIRDLAEYNAYMTAVNTKDAAARAASLEAFARQYPHSVVYTDALEQEMAAWQEAGDQEKIKEAARKLLAADGGNVRALAIVVALDRYSAERGDTSSLDEACLDSTAGMREVPMWQKPEGMSDADFDKLQKQMASIFNGAEGFCAWEEKNYSQAQDWLSRAFLLDGTDMQDAYQLAVVDLQMKPEDADGFWYCARAIQLAKSTNKDDAAGAMTAACRDSYVKYHGGFDGWDALLAAAATQDALPPNFAAGIKAAPAKPAATAAPVPK